jgi:hypothetical protein
MVWYRIKNCAEILESLLVTDGGQGGERVALTGSIVLLIQERGQEIGSVG